MRSMNNMITILQKNRMYFLGLMFFFIIGIVLLLVLDKTATSISLNAYHPFWLNVFFINYTFIGDGIFALCLAAFYIFYLKKQPEGMALLAGFILSGIIVQLIKNLVISPRAKLFFEPGQYLFFVDNVPLINNASFPSGHTATAFAISTILILMIKNKNRQLLLLFAAILVGYSRIYLAQHFVVDVLAGAFIGSMSGIIAVYLIKNRKRINRSLKDVHIIQASHLIPSQDTIQPG